MAARAILTNYLTISATGVSGEFTIKGVVAFLDDTSIGPVTAHINPMINYSTMTQAQIQTIVIDAIIELGASMGFTLAAGNSQIIIPQLLEV